MATQEDEEYELSVLPNEATSFQAPTTLQEKTLLPAPFASLVSLVTRSSLVSLRLGSFLGGLAIDGARLGTLTGLELSRSVLENVFLRGGQDVVERSTGDLGKAEAEGILERSIATLHSTVTQASFFVSTGFHLSSVALSSVSTLSSHLLSALDAILGSTESSRAIASIVTLIRREFRNPETGANGERVGVLDLLVGVTGLALLQRWCSRRLEEEIRIKGSEDIIWDVVVLDNGRRADVVGIRGEDSTRQATRAESFISATGRPEVYETSQYRNQSERNEGAFDSSGGRDELTEMELRHRLLDQLPPHAQISIKTEVMTTKTITVEVLGVEPPHISPPPGTHIIEENAHHEQPSHPGAMFDGAIGGDVEGLPHYRVVFQTVPAADEKRVTQNSFGQPSETEFHCKVSDFPEMDGSTSLESDPGASSPAISPLRDSTPTTASFPPLVDHLEDSDSRMGHVDAHPSYSGDNTSKNDAEINANEKRARKPPTVSSHLGRLAQPTFATIKRSESRSSSKGKPNLEKPEKKSSTFRRALKKGTSSKDLASMFGRDEPVEACSVTGKTVDRRPPWGSNKNGTHTKQPSLPPTSVPSKRAGPSETVSPPRAPQRGNPNYFSSRDLIETADYPRSPSRASFYSIHEHRRQSLVSQTDTFSLQSADMSRPGSPTQVKTHRRTTSNVARAQAHRNLTVDDMNLPSPRSRASHKHAPSIYTLRTNLSDTSLVLASRPEPSALDSPEAISRLQRDGMIKGQFPRGHLVESMSRFARFSLASYGSSFLKLMGLSSAKPADVTEHKFLEHHHEHHSFSSHTRLPPATILLSSFVDPQGGTNAAGETNSGVPLIHFVSLDHESKAVVLTCRGTLGFEDVLADMTCDYDDLQWNDNSYKVHKGIHASARRLLDGAGGRVMTTIKAALEEFTDYGLVMCGHSLGGGVAALLAIMISERDPALESGSAFRTVTTRQSSPLRITNGEEESYSARAVSLPPGRPIHVFAYGSPASVSPSLRIATCGLVTTVVNGQDVVPFLSLGTLHDLQAIALAFKLDKSNAKGEVRNRVWEGLKNGLIERINGTRSDFVDEEVDDQWSYSALKSLRASMLSPKLLPPGEVFIVETQPVLQRDAFATGRESSAAAPVLGRPAQRAMLKYIRDVEDVESPSLDSSDSDVRALVVYIPHASDPSEIPFYHPTVRAVGFLYASSTISIHYALFPSITLSTRLSSTAKHLLATIHKHGVGIMKGYVKRGLHDRIVPQATYQDTYTRLKLTHARRLVEGWREVTDPGKHVFEDLGIAAYLIEIWTLMYGQDSNVNGMAASTEMAKECFPGFVDIGCGNGVLVDVLREEGWKGWGFDARRRKSWEGFPKHVQMESLKEALLVPEPFLSSSHSSMQVQEEIDRLRDLSLLGQGAHAEDNESQTNEASSIEKGPTIHNGIFPSGTFIISNHADELTAWTPLLASLSGNCPFLIIPCCSHDLSGARFRAPNPPKTSTTNQRITETASGHTGSLGSIIPSSTQSSSAYAALVEWVAGIALDLGFDVEYDMLRIPSTRNAALLSRRMRQSLDHAQQNSYGTGNETNFKESAIYNKVGENQTTGVALNVSDIIERETNAKGRAAGGSGEAWIQRTLKLMQKQGKGKEKGHGSVKRKELAHSKLEGP
ncbi:MAG: hypothetical protein M4579_001315 [Chaenotheca gracillima]|nr:MAG: hypothetical protein M4579_001315 [Chaenotheca gracillima]